MSDSSILVSSNLEKCGNFMVGLGKYSMGGYGRIGVHRVNGFI